MLKIGSTETTIKQLEQILEVLRVSKELGGELGIEKKVDSGVQSFGKEITSRSSQLLNSFGGLQAILSGCSKGQLEKMPKTMAGLEDLKEIVLKDHENLTCEKLAYFLSINSTLKITISPLGAFLARQPVEEFEKAKAFIQTLDTIDFKDAKELNVELLKYLYSVKETLSVTISPLNEFLIKQTEENLSKLTGFLKTVKEVSFEKIEELTIAKLEILFKANEKMNVTIKPLAEFIVANTAEDIAKIGFIGAQIKSMELLQFVKTEKLLPDHIKFISEACKERTVQLKLKIDGCKNIGYEHLGVFKGSGIKLSFTPAN